MRRSLPIAALVLAAGFLAAKFSGAPGEYLAMGAGGGGALGATAILLAWHASRAASGTKDFQGMLRAAAAEWKPRRRERLEGLVAESVGPGVAAHALRVTALCDALAEQLAMGAEEAADLSLAASLHVLPKVFGGDSPEELPCGHTPWALATTSNAVATAVSARAGRMAGDFCERWDGTGLPSALIGEEASLGGRVIAATCAFDRASTTSLESALETLRAGTGTLFDPVIVAELLHLFRETWQSRQAA